VDLDWLAGYVDAWVRHGAAGGGDVAAMDRLLAFMSPEIKYEDVPTSAVFLGHDGVRAMAAQAHALATDLTFHPRNLAVGDGCFAFETETRGTQSGAVGSVKETNRPFVIRGVSVGEVVDGQVTEHRDYWDLSSLLVQLGG
jgi:ketosteroid isomerase-like protein